MAGNITKEGMLHGSTFNAGYNFDYTMQLQIHMDSLRRERIEKLQALDIEWMKAFAQGKTKDAESVEAKRQKLRDMPKIVRSAMDAVTTTDELKAISLDTGG